MPTEPAASVVLAVLFVGVGCVIGALIGWGLGPSGIGGVLASMAGALVGGMLALSLYASLFRALLTVARRAET